jgi:hypothetical protein
MMLTAITIFAWIYSILLCVWIAGERRRSVIGFGLLALVIGPLALPFVIFAREAPESIVTPDREAAFQAAKAEFMAGRN